MTAANFYARLFACADDSGLLQRLALNLFAVSPLTALSSTAPRSRSQHLPRHTVRAVSYHLTPSTSVSMVFSHDGICQKMTSTSPSVQKIRPSVQCLANTANQELALASSIHSKTTQVKTLQGAKIINVSIKLNRTRVSARCHLPTNDEYISPC